MPPIPGTLKGAWAIKARQRREAGLPVYESSIDGGGGTAASDHVDSERGFTPGYTTRPKKAKALRESLANAAIAAHDLGVQVNLPPFPSFQSAEYESHAAMLLAFQEYCAMHNVAYRVRQSTSRERRNKELKVIYDASVQKATERIENGVVLGEYLGELSLETGLRSERTNNEGFRLHYHKDRDAWGDAEVCVNALLGGSLMRFLNHSCTPCAKFYEVGNGRRRTIVATTVRAIRPGEEITVNYGSDLWFTCRCVRCEEAAATKAA